MGPYDNSASCYVLSEEVMNAIWLVNSNTDSLIIIRRAGDGFDSYGGVEEDETLFELNDEELNDEDAMEARGYTSIYQPFRRFCTTAGYYYA